MTEKGGRGRPNCGRECEERWRRASGGSIQNVCCAPTLDADEIRGRGSRKTDDDEDEVPTPKATRTRARFGEPVSKITLAVRRHRARLKAMAESVA